MDWEAFYNNFRKPDFIAGYEIQNRLGGGAFGEVYKARKHSIGKAYAIKFLKIDDDGQREAIERELEQVRHFAAIDHPNLVTIEDLGIVMDVPFVVMGYAGEETLAKKMRAQKLEVSQALLYFVQACRGVLALHDRRLVHFDLKPGNVFLKGDIARVGDYGLSKLMIDGRMTLSFGRGTPQYMAPEMLKNRADHRADIYSLGVVLYEAIAGKLPFEGDTPSGLVLREKDEPPEFPDDFPASARPVVERCLRIQPHDRYANVTELLADLGQTARPGDSVVLSLPKTPPVVPSASSSSSVASEESEPGSDDLRQTAAELARGAVEVARGVWDGIRSPKKESDAQLDFSSSSADRDGEREVATATASAAAPTDEGDASAWKEESARVGFGREISYEGGRGASSAVVVPAVADPETPATSLERSLAPLTLGGGAALEKGGAAQPGTIPVPPRVVGGAVGTVISTLVLGLEVLVTLVTGLAAQAVRLFSGTSGRILKSTGSLFGRLVRFGLFLLLLAFLGGGLTFILVALLDGL